MNNHEIRDMFYSNQSVKASESFIQIMPLEKNKQCGTRYSTTMTTNSGVKSPTKLIRFARKQIHLKTWAVTSSKYVS